MFDNDKVLVYHYRHNGDPVIKDGLAIIAQSALVEILASHPELQSSTRKISRGKPTMDIHQSDVAGSFFDDDLPNSQVNVANVCVPLRAVLGACREMVILSKRVDVASSVSDA